MSSNGARPIGELTAELHHRFATSDYGKILSERTRYADYQPDHVSNEEWERMFGADVNNLDHLPLTHSLTRGFVWACRNPHRTWEGPVPGEARFTDANARVMEIAAIIHDWPEAPLRDVMYHLKTDADDAAEDVELHQLLAELVPEHYRDPEFQLAVIVTADKYGKTSLGRAFNTVERMGYVRTGVRFWEQRQVSTDPVLKEELDFISHFVFATHVPVLVERARLYPAADEFLRDRLTYFDAIVSDYTDDSARPDAKLAQSYDKHLRADDPMRSTHRHQFNQAAEMLAARYAVDGLPASA